MKKLFVLSFILIITLAHHAGAQEVDVYYNLTNDEITYFGDGVEMEQPKIKKGQTIKVHIEEYNPYLYDLVVEVEERTIGTMGGAMSNGIAGVPGFGSFLSSFGAFDMGGKGLSFGDGMPLLNMPLLTINDNPITLQSLFGKSRGSAEIMQNANKAMQEVSNSIQKLQMSYNQVRQMNSSAFFGNMARQNIDKVKFHPNLKPSMIRQICRQYYERIYPHSEEGEVSLKDLEYWRDFGSKYSSLVSEINKEQTGLSRQLTLLQLYTDQLSSQAFEEKEYRDYITDLLAFQKESREFNSHMEETIQELPESLDHPSVKEMADLQIELAEIVSNDFTYHTRVQPTKDELELTLKLTPKEGFEPAGNKKTEPILERKYTMEVRGGLKLNASIGVAFSQFFDAQYKYSTKSGVIVADKSGQFSPAVASFLHFYGYNGKRTNFGGTFGVGFPIFSETDQFSIQFFLGPSLIIGSSERLVITAGVMGGSANRLGKGYKVGDPFDSDLGDIPLTSPFEFGAFAGISFNIMGG